MSDVGKRKRKRRRSPSSPRRVSLHSLAGLPLPSSPLSRSASLSSSVPSPQRSVSSVASESEALRLQQRRHSSPRAGKRSRSSAAAAREPGVRHPSEVTALPHYYRFVHGKKDITAAEVARLPHGAKLTAYRDPERLVQFVKNHKRVGRYMTKFHDFYDGAVQGHVDNEMEKHLDKFASKLVDQDRPENAYILATLLYYILEYRLNFGSKSRDSDQEDGKEPARIWNDAFREIRSAKAPLAIPSTEMSVIIGFVNEFSKEEMAKELALCEGDRNRASCF